jgi:hypothetical protein
MSEISNIDLPQTENFWRDTFAAEQIDFVPDPMVMRVADLFIGGKSFAVKAKLDPAKVWDTIAGNLDALLAFFHLLMTRERIPLIDYDATFDITNFGMLEKLAVAVHSPLYYEIRQEAIEKLNTKVDFGRIPQLVRESWTLNRLEEIEATGYKWFPDPGEKFDDSPDRLIAIRLLGALIFGTYAQISGTDHVLHASGSRVLLEMTQPKGDEIFSGDPYWSGKQEAKVFGRLNALANTDAHLRAGESRTPPTVVPFLLDQGVKFGTELLAKALALRESDKDFVAYRGHSQKMRTAWRDGTHDMESEKDVAAVTQELELRYPPGKDPRYQPPIWRREIGLKGKIGMPEFAVEMGGVKGSVALGGPEIEADVGKVPVWLPDWVRAWLLEKFYFRAHRKVLLRLALAQHLRDNMLIKLKPVWLAG